MITENQEIAALVAKVKRDPIYGPAYALLGESLEEMYQAGFFDDGAREDLASIEEASDEWLVTPVEKLRRRLTASSEGQRVAVLLMTGSFCPVHSGHIESLEIARRELEKRGIFVAAGYLSPSHDSYVSTKGPDTLDAVDRLDLCQAATADSDWLMADGWEALGVDRAVNFTDVIVRLERYLRRHVISPSPIEVYYVFSSDHARFCKAFVAAGQCVCTVRPEFRDNVSEFLGQEHVEGNSRIIFALQQREQSSSRMVRDGRLDLLHPKVRELYQEKLLLRSRGIASDAEMYYALREEGELLIEGWADSRSVAELKKRVDALLAGVVDLLSSAHNGRPVRVEVSRPRAGCAVNLSGRKEGRVISIDGFIEGDVNLGVSRCFPIGDPYRAPEVSERPGWPTLSAQVEAIPRGYEYTLFDDDVDTGRTKQAVERLLTAGGVKLLGFKTLIYRSELSDSPGCADILDFRDFLVGVSLGGLVVRLPDGSLGRAPYLYPYCSPSQRASIPLANELEFSREVWLLNQRFFHGITSPISLGEADPSFQKLMNASGFPLDMPMEEICSWHAENCDRTLKRYRNGAKPQYTLLGS